MADVKIASTNRILNITRTVLELTIQSIVFIAVMAMIVFGAIKRSDDYIVYVFAIVIPVLISFLARKKVKKLVPFTIIHVVMLIAFASLGKTQAEATAYFVGVFVIVFRSFALRMSNIKRYEFTNVAYGEEDMTDLSKEERQASILSSERMHVAYCLVMVAGYFAGNNVKSEMLMGLEVVCFVLFILLQVVSNQIKGVNEIFLQNAGKSEFPAERIMSINIIMIIAIAFFMVIGMILFYNGKYGNIFSAIGAGFTFIFHWIFKLILMLLKEDVSPVEEEVPTTPEQEVTDGTNFRGDLVVQEGNNVMAIITEAVIIMMLVLVVAFVVYLLFKYARRFKVSSAEELDEVEFLGDKKRKEIRLAKRKRKEELKNAPLNAQYRKIFKKKVLAASKHGEKKKPLESMQPIQITRSRLTKEKMLADEITKSYEKARYSKESVSKEDIDKLRNI